MTGDVDSGGTPKIGVPAGAGAASSEFHARLREIVAERESFHRRAAEILEIPMRDHLREVLRGDLASQRKAAHELNLSLRAAGLCFAEADSKFPAVLIAHETMSGKIDHRLSFRDIDGRRLQRSVGNATDSRRWRIIPRPLAGGSLLETHSTFVQRLLSRSKGDHGGTSNQV